jgi:arylsulfatase A-like enzyme
VGAENRWTARYALWAFHRVRDPRLLMVSLSETDVLGHFATDTRAIRALMREFDALLGQIVDAYRRAGLLGRTDFVVTADHGMSAIHATLPYSVLTRAVAQAGATPVYIEHDTAAAIGIREDRKARAVAVNISRLGGERVDATYYKVRDHGRWSYRLAAARSAVPAPLRSAYRLLMDTVAAASGPDVLAVYAPHVSTRTTVAYGYSWRAGHLGPQWPDQHIPLILAGPGVERGLISSYPARLVDIAPTVEYLLGARRQGLDGVVLADALGGVGPRLRRSQRGRAALLTPVVQALVHRSDRQ